MLGVLAIVIVILLCMFIYYMVRTLIISLDAGLPWFFCSLFIPFFIYIYAFMHWDAAEKPFIRGHIAFIVALALGGVYMANMDPNQTVPQIIPKSAGTRY